MSSTVLSGGCRLSVRTKPEPAAPKRTDIKYTFKFSSSEVVFDGDTQGRPEKSTHSLQKNVRTVSFVRAKDLQSVMACVKEAGLLLSLTFRAAHCKLCKDPLHADLLISCQLRDIVEACVRKGPRI